MVYRPVEIATARAEAAKAIIGRVVTVLPEKTFANISKELIAMGEISRQEA